MIYLASPYSHPDPLIMRTRFLIAEQVCAQLMEAGHYIYSPIVHCHALAERYALPTDFAWWQGYNFDMIRRADAFYVLTIDGWMESKGVTAELDFAKWCGMEMCEVSAEGVVQTWQR